MIAPRPGQGRRYCVCKSSWATAEHSEKLDSCFTLVIGGEAMPVAICINHLRWASAHYKNDKRTCFIHCYSIDPTQEINDVKIGKTAIEEMEEFDQEALKKLDEWVKDGEL